MDSTQSECSKPSTTSREGSNASCTTNQPPMPRPIEKPKDRQNEYFLPRNGIEREVISADITHYLGNDALVRPGMYEVSSYKTSATDIMQTLYLLD